MTPIPPPDEALRLKWSLWEELQVNGAHAYLNDPASNLSVAGRSDAEAFGDFCHLNGSVLDIGCGPRMRPSYACAGRFVGIDPLRGERNRDFDFVQGIGEYLPFREDTFDHVLFAGTLDHLLEPERALCEAARVLVPSGTIELWFGEPPDPPGAVQRATYALTLLRRGDLREFARGVGHRLGLLRTMATNYSVPRGAADEFHFLHLTPAGVEGMIAAVGLKTLECICSTPDHYFLRAAAVRDRPKRPRLSE